MNAMHGMLPHPARQAVPMRHGLDPSSCPCHCRCARSTVRACRVAGCAQAGAVLAVSAHVRTHYVSLLAPALRARSSRLDCASRRALRQVDRARRGAADRVGSSSRRVLCRPHQILRQMVLHFDAAASSKKLKGGLRHVQLLLLASLVAVDARVLTEASVRPAPALQNNAKTLSAEPQLQASSHFGEFAVASSQFCREEVSRYPLTMHDTDSAARPTREGHHGKECPALFSLFGSTKTSTLDAHSGSSAGQHDALDGLPDDGAVARPRRAQCDGIGYNGEGLQQAQTGRKGFGPIQPGGTQG